jgi:hypothetical protein
MRPTFLSCAFAGALALFSTGCIKAMLVNGQIEGTRQASGAFDTIGDYEMARSAAQAGLVQFEGMHRLAPSNDDALFMLTKGWTGYGFGFIEDDMEAAEDAGDQELADYHRKRARMAYDRAVFYGLELLGHKSSDLDTAKKNDQSLRAWLADNFSSTDDAANLFWTGYAWMARVNLMKGDEEEGPAFIADLYVGVAMVERAVALDPSFESYSGLVALGAYHARSAIAELGDAKKLFDTAVEKTQGKNLIVQLNYATKYACAKGDRVLYEQMINTVLQAADPDPYHRLSNAIAKRRAKRWLGKKRMKDACGIDASAPLPAPAPAPAPAPSPSPAPAPAPAAAPTPRADK